MAATTDEYREQADIINKVPTYPNVGIGAITSSFNSALILHYARIKKIVSLHSLC